MGTIGGGGKLVETPGFGRMGTARLKRMAQALFVSGEERSEICEQLGINNIRLGMWIKSGGWEEARQERAQIYMQRMVEQQAGDQVQEDAAVLKIMLKRRRELALKMEGYGSAPGQDTSRGLRATQAVIDRLTETVGSASGKQIVGYEYISVDNGPDEAAEAAARAEVEAATKAKPKRARGGKG